MHQHDYTMIQRLIFTLGRNRHFPKSSSEIHVQLGGANIQFKLTGRLSMRERKVILLLLHHHLKPLFQRAGIQVITHQNSDFFNPWGQSKKGLITARPATIDTEVNTIGFIFRMKRLKMGLSQKDFSRISGMSRGHISLIERGIHKMHPTTKTKIEAIIGSKLD